MSSAKLTDEDLSVCLHDLFFQFLLIGAVSFGG